LKWQDKIMQKIRTAVFDIDGTLAMMDKKSGQYTVLLGAVEAIELCHKASMEVIAYTNGTFFPPAHYYPRLAEVGLNFKAGRILTPAVVAAFHLKEKGHRRIMALGVEGTTVPMIEAGFEIFPAEKTDEKLDAVLIGWTRHFGLDELEALVEAVWRGAVPYSMSDAPFFAGANGRILGVSGAVGAMIAHTAQVTPIVLGKPSLLGMEMITRLTGHSASETVVIGDDPSLEIKMARLAGAYAIGVTTGLYNETDFMRAAEGERANHVLSSLEGFASQPWFTVSKELSHD
jgi:HAD superfamily hydrolase (TIGR01450 family)